MTPSILLSLIAPFLTSVASLGDKRRTTGRHNWQQLQQFVTGQHDNPVLIYDSDAPTGTDQTVTFTGNTFNYGSDANIYPVIIGAGCKINEELTSPIITFDTDYPAAYRYIVLSRGVGYSSNHRNAVWGDAGIPYLLAGEITITGKAITLLPFISVICVKK